MRKFALQDSVKSLELLERKLSLSALSSAGFSAPAHVGPVMMRVLDDDPAPDSDPPTNPLSGPIYPTLPHSGPLGPG